MKKIFRLVNENKMVLDSKRFVRKCSKTTVRPRSKKELEQIINKTIAEYGNECDLNFIDTSLIDDMSYLFSHSKFNGDISKWVVNNVKDMSNMFLYSKFNGNISKWDVSKVRNMFAMFKNSRFNGNISKWYVSNVRDMGGMFANSRFNGDINEKWDISKVKNMLGMFANSPLQDKYGRNGEYLK